MPFAIRLESHFKLCVVANSTKNTKRCPHCITAWGVRDMQQVREGLREWNQSTVTSLDIDSDRGVKANSVEESVQDGV